MLLGQLWFLFLTLVPATASPAVVIESPANGEFTLESHGIAVKFSLSGEAGSPSSLCFGLRKNDAGASFNVDPMIDALRCDHDIAHTWNDENGTRTAWKLPPMIRLKSVPLGCHAVWVVLAVNGESVVAVSRFNVVPPVFEPSYEYAVVAKGQSIPQGLDVTMDLSSGLHQARIPASWRLQVWLDETSRFFRADVSRHTLISDLAEAAASALQARAECVSIAVTEHPKPTRLISLGASAEEVGLFEVRSQLKFMTSHGC